MSKKRPKTQPRKIVRRELADITKQCLELINSQPEKNFSTRKLFKELKISDQYTKNELKKILDELVKMRVLGINEDRCFYSLQQNNSRSTKEYHEGVVDFVNKDFAYVVCEGVEKDVWVNAKYTNQALDGDRVKVKIFKKYKDKNPEGEIIEIIERNRNEFVGRIELFMRYAFVVADHRKMHYDIFVPLQDCAGAKQGEKVVVKITEWRKGDKNPTGIITKVLGKAGENEVEMHSIMHEFGLPYEFDTHIEEAANNLPTEISAQEIVKRRDFRNITTFTIDPDNAKDFDDALSIQKLPNGNWEIGVHIADVTHYVTPNSDIEKEALKRATSVYLVDRVIPMLPEKLSNELCSLRPHEDKLTFSVVFELNDAAQIKNSWYGRTIIYSDRRFTYEEAQERIETQSGDFAEEINILNELAKKIKEKRFENGAISFESLEVKFILDENGRPLGVKPKVRKDAHKLIEEFMLLANKYVAEFAYKFREGKEKNVMVYRIHEAPDPEKLENLSSFARRFGYKIETSPEKLAFSLNKLAIDSEGKPEHYILQQLSIRAMAKARYSTQAEGHFGLAFAHYSHFTSPIRRYPDMMAHRFLQHYLDQKPPQEREGFEIKCRHSSEMEKRAADAERASIKYKQVEFMSQFINQIFDGIIVSITEWGLYVEITETACEGMIRITDIGDDFYEYDSRNHCIRGVRYNKTYAIGDKIKVCVKGTDLERRTIDLLLEV